MSLFSLNIGISRRFYIVKVQCVFSVDSIDYIIPLLNHLGHFSKVITLLFLIKMWNIKYSHIRKIYEKRF